MAKKVNLKFKTYNILSDAVDSGVEYGYMRAYKHTDTPSEESIKNCIATAVMSYICEVVDFGDE